MSFNNPTPVKVGMTGVFSGVNYRVLGRVVMGVVDDGTTYYWNEFNLKADSGEEATLVYEVTESGAEWRWFTMFDPQFPITAADAATKRVGDPINLDGTDVSLTLLDRSRIYYIEGEAPEGEEVGDVAQYFNAESGRNMIVVSWTGDEVECYHGVTVGSMTVARAFNLPAASVSGFTLSGTEPTRSSFRPAMIFGLGIIVVFFAIAGLSFKTTRVAKIKKISAPTADLKVGSSGKIEGKNYTVVGDALVEVREVNQVIQRHEFHLRGEDGNGALLIHGWKPGANDWCLLTLADVSESMTPQQAAAVQYGKAVVVDSQSATVNDLFNSIILKVDTQDILLSTTGKIFYGFSAESGHGRLMARWDDDSINFYKGYILPDDVAASFLRSAK